MGENHRHSGIAAVGTIPWGSHFCQFYRDEADLAETLIPFFKAGLEGNEACLWVTSGALTDSRATALLRKAVPDLDVRIAAGQLDIVPIDRWYTPGETFDSEAVLAGWIERERLARARGFDGLRLSGDTIWVQRSGWNDFMDYERKVNGAFRSLRLVALCTYCADTCTASDVIDVCSHHEFALSRREGQWQLLESSSLKTAKEELVRLNAELEQRVAARTEALNAALQARDEFLAMLGHELRNPLAPIRTAAEFISKNAPAHTPIGKSSAILTRQVSHIARLVDDLLDVARITQGQVQIEPVDVALASIIEMAVEQARPFLQQRRHEFTLVLPADDVTVFADPTRLAQVFGNLLHNAAKYTPDGGTIALTTTVDRENTTISVRDNGGGIPRDKLDAIFDLFSQLPRSLARSDGGLGIGLTLAKRIVEAHGGTIEARSAGTDQGSEFIVRLATRRAVATVIPSASSAQSKRRILLVDDNCDAREILAALLDMQGYEVIVADHATSALEKVKTFAPDVAILDIGLPDIDGYELATLLRATSMGDRIKLIALTGYGAEKDVARAMEAGFHAHVLKPARLEELVANIDGAETIPALASNG